jgi:hypothetical protein
LVQSGISIIKSYYGTGGDLNVDEIHEVIPMEECGVWHPQEGALMVTSNLLKPTRLIELVNYVKVWLR